MIAGPLASLGCHQRAERPLCREMNPTRRLSADQLGDRLLPPVLSGVSVRVATSRIQTSLFGPELSTTAACLPLGDNRTKPNSRMSFAAGRASPVRSTHTIRRFKAPRAITRPPALVRATRESPAPSAASRIESSTGTALPDVRPVRTSNGTAMTTPSARRYTSRPPTTPSALTAVTPRGTTAREPTETDASCDCSCAPYHKLKSTVLPSSTTVGHR